MIFAFLEVAIPNLYTTTLIGCLHYWQYLIFISSTTSDTISIVWYIIVLTVIGTVFDISTFIFDLHYYFFKSLHSIKCQWLTAQIEIPEIEYYQY